MVKFCGLYVLFSLGFREMKNDEMRQRAVLGSTLWRFQGRDF